MTGRPVRSFYSRSALTQTRSTSITTSRVYRKPHSIDGSLLLAAYVTREALAVMESLDPHSFVLFGGTCRSRARSSWLGAPRLTISVRQLASSLHRFIRIGCADDHDSVRSSPQAKSPYGPRRVLNTYAGRRRKRSSPLWDRAFFVL